MSEDSDYKQMQPFSERRLLTTMTILCVIAVAFSLIFNDWRATAGLILGCILSFANLLWARKSFGAMLAKSVESGAARFSIIRYFFRYLIFTAVVVAGYSLNLISVVWALVGLLTFIAAIFILAFIQLFTVLLKREET